jgi:hypothetical protein
LKFKFKYIGKNNFCIPATATLYQSVQLCIPAHELAKPRYYKEVKGTVSKDFLLQIFHESSSPKLLKITLGSFQIFEKIC